jgi:threonyl-tRNA synthetase
MEEQVKDEVAAIVTLMKRVYGAVNLPFSAKFSTRPPVRIGDDAQWDRAEGSLRGALEATGMAWELNAGDGAFYGPKIDFDVTDSLGRKWQLCTIQLDYAAPQKDRFDLTYIGNDNHEHRPVVIHRAIYGSLERFTAILVEHFGGAFPAWLAPVQARLVTVSEKHDVYAKETGARLKALGFRVEVDTSNEKLGAKIREAQLQKIPFTVVVGDKEAADGGVSPRRFGGDDLKFMKLDAFIELLGKEAALPYGN